MYSKQQKQFIEMAKEWKYCCPSSEAFFYKLTCFFIIPLVFISFILLVTMGYLFSEGMASVFITLTTLSTFTFIYTLINANKKLNTSHVHLIKKVTFTPDFIYINNNQIPLPWLESIKLLEVAMPTYLGYRLHIFKLTLIPNVIINEEIYFGVKFYSYNNKFTHHPYSANRNYDYQSQFINIINDWIYEKKQAFLIKNTDHEPEEAAIYIQHELDFLSNEL